MFATYPNFEYLSPTTVLIDQIIATAALLIAIMAVTDAPGIHGPRFLLPLQLVIIIEAIPAAFSFHSGVALNMARDFPPRLFTWLVGFETVFRPTQGLYWILAPILGNFIGATLGVWIYKLFVGFHRPVKGDDAQVRVITCPRCLTILLPIVEDEIFVYRDPLAPQVKSLYARMPTSHLKLPSHERSSTGEDAMSALARSAPGAVTHGCPKPYGVSILTGRRKFKGPKARLIRKHL